MASQVSLLRKETTMNTRRALLSASLAAMTVPLARGSTRALPVSQDGASERHVPGGFGGLESARFTFTPTSHDEDYGTIILPPTPPILTYMIPLTVVSYDESSRSRYQLQDDGTVTVMKDGLYILTANFDSGSTRRSTFRARSRR
jgi:hypothetical protein